MNECHAATVCCHILCNFALALFPSAVATQAEEFSKTFHSPRIGGKRLDGCFSFPGKCRAQQQANAFCKRRGFAFASDFSVSNRLGLYQAKPLGDGGTCTASCTVMTRVVCIAEGHGYE